MKSINHRSFLKTGAGFAVVSAVATREAFGFIPAHNWEKYDFGPGPIVTNRLNQGPFPIYAPEEVIPYSEVVMATSPSKKVLKNFGMSLTVYVSGDIGPPNIPGETTKKSIEDLVKLPFVQKNYMRPDWREVQKQAGKLDFIDYWNITFDLAAKYDNRIAFRVMLEN